MFTYLLFDLDGTLTDPAEGITRAVQYALRSHGIEVADRKELEVFIGPPLRDSYREFYGIMDEAVEACVEKYREYYIPVGILENELYPGMVELLEKCRQAGKTMAIASSKPLAFVHTVLRHFQIESYFDVIMGCEMDGTRATKIEVVEEVLRRLHLERTDPEVLKKEVVMIGDRKFDVEGGRNFGLSTIGVRYGYADSGELEAAGADFIADTVADLEDILL